MALQVERQAAPAVDAPARSGLDYRWVAASVVVVGALMSILNQTVINVALPTLESDFGVSLTEIQWVVTGYSLGLAAVIPLTGWLADRYGTKRVFLVSQVLFTLASMLCGLAWNNPSMVAFRVVQGLAGGLIMPVGMTILMTVTRPEERGRAMAVLGLPMLVAPVLGPLLGGWLVQYVTWRLIFYLNVPIGVVGVLMTAALLRRSAGHAGGRRLDAGGLVLGIPAVVAIVYGLSQPGAYGWASAETLLPLAAGIAMLVVFCFYELRQSNPLIEIRVFKDAAFTAAMLLNFFIGVALFGSVVLVPLFLQQVQGYGALESGVVLAAQGLAAALAMPIGGALTDRFGARQVVPFGLALLTLCSAWMATLAVDTPRWEIALMVAGRGMGIGLSMIPSMSSAYVTLAPTLIARATSVSNTVQRVASALAVAIVATILAGRISAHLPGNLGAAAASGGGLAGVHLPAAVESMLLAQVAKGFDDTFWVTVGLSLICFPMALLLRRSLRPEVVRAYALRQLTEGVILGAAARRLDGQLGPGADRELAERRSRMRRILAAHAPHPTPGNPHPTTAISRGPRDLAAGLPRSSLTHQRMGSLRSSAPDHDLGHLDDESLAACVTDALAGGARTRLQRGFTLLRAGTSASGLVPQAPISPALWVLFAVLLVAALVGSVLVVMHGAQTPVVPPLPPRPA